ncbi:UBP-type zinc finger domain-containing protein [Nocardioides sp. 1609]|uniref:UBP-type zinc finger domain-containing protein n=1 Tax=Nocardioides sp. 1609 TaxID=2508327 RepID=UPI00107026D8|nr:UBP-type zinc finger domain-containing protein [Nocardioides sp. 1609]
MTDPGATPTDAVDLSVPPSGAGCVECDSVEGWWVHLRRCAACGHVGCCDSSPGQHASAHFAATGHSVMQSFEPGEDWFWDFAHAAVVDMPAGFELAEPRSHPADQPAPGPRGRVPADWRSHVH